MDIFLFLTILGIVVAIVLPLFIAIASRRQLKFAFIISVILLIPLIILLIIQLVNASQVNPSALTPTSIVSVITNQTPSAMATATSTVLRTSPTSTSTRGVETSTSTASVAPMTSPTLTNREARLLSQLNSTGVPNSFVELLFPALLANCQTWSRCWATYSNNSSIRPTVDNVTYNGEALIITASIPSSIVLRTQEIAVRMTTSLDSIYIAPLDDDSLDDLIQISIDDYPNATHKGFIRVDSEFIPVVIVPP